MTTLAPFAQQRLTPFNHDVGGVVRPPQGMVVHTAVGSFAGTDQWEHDAKSHISSYFIVAQDGRIDQEVDLANRAWTQAAGNAAWIGVENEGNSATPLTPAQIKANGQILAWLHEIYGVPLQLTTDPINGRGLGYHSMGGTAWSPAHHNCPGPVIVGQLGEIVAAALGLTPTPHPTPHPPEVEHVIIVRRVNGQVPDHPAFEPQLVDIDCPNKRLVLYNGAQVEESDGVVGYSVRVVPVPTVNGSAVLGGCDSPQFGGFSVFDATGREHPFHWKD